MARFGVAATTRASLGAYNNEEDVKQLAGALQKASRMLR